MILWWKDNGNHLTCVKNEDGSIRLFNTLEEADNFATFHPKSDDMRVISIEGVKA
jgi:hypothetical protein